MRKAREIVTLVAASTLAVGLAMPQFAGVASASGTSGRTAVNCGSSTFTCAEIPNSDEVFGHYVGHDEPSTLFYSNKPGSGNRMQYSIQLPKEPSPSPKVNGSYSFMLRVADWFGMAMCDTQSYPEQMSTCTPDSDTNVPHPEKSAKFPGAAYMEMQFYPPGWSAWPAGVSCDPTKWCAALTIDSYSDNPVTHTPNNKACLNTVGIEYVNFAFITKSGKPHGPPAPVNATNKTYTPDKKRDLFMNQGDRVTVRFHDTAHGLRVELADTSTGQSGSMTASAANGFGQVKYAPKASTCTNIPYDFHPMYSTSRPGVTRVAWAAGTYNVAYDAEIGHFDYCTNVDTTKGTCVGQEGMVGDREPADADDYGCFSAAQSQLVPVSGCIGTNVMFDGTSYKPLWPNGQAGRRPTPFFFSSPKTGAGYNVNYSRAGLETDLPAIEDKAFSPANHCDSSTGKGCVKLPFTDDGVHADFYPFFTIGQHNGGCMWAIGQNVPGFSTRDFGALNQYGPLFAQPYLNGHGHEISYEDFLNVLPNNPCPA